MLLMLLMLLMLQYVAAEGKEREQRDAWGLGHIRCRREKGLIASKITKCHSFIAGCVTAIKLFQDDFVGI